MGGCLVGFALYIEVGLAYHGALTGVIGKAALPGTTQVEQLPSRVFWKEGRKHFSGSAATAALASILPLPGLLLLLGIAALFVIRFSATLFTGELGGSLILLALVLAGAAVLVLSLLLSWLAVLWYRYALCALCIESLGAGAAMRAALSFFSRKWPLVLGLVLATIFLSMLSGLLLASWGIITDVLDETSFALWSISKALAMSLGVALGVFMELWFKAALVVLYIDNK